MKPKVTVIVPAFNEERGIQRCVDSLLNQSIVPSIIVVNDGSTDSTLNKLSKYKKNDNVMIVNQKNQGVSVARNNGLKHTLTEFVTFVDADDYVEKNFVQTLLEGYSRGKQIDLTVCNYSMKRLTDGVSFCGNFTTSVINKSVYFSSVITDDGVNGFVYNKMFKLSIINRYNVFFNPKIAIGEDFLFCFLYGIHCVNIAVDKSVQIHYMPSNNGASDTMQLAGRFSPKIFSYFDANLRIIKILHTYHNQYISILYNQLYRTVDVAVTILRKVYLYRMGGKYRNSLRALRKFLYSNLVRILRSKEVNSGDKAKLLMVVCFPHILGCLDRIRFRRAND